MATFPFEGLTYDDVTLVTQYADFLPDDASLETNLTSRQKMKIPFISAAMDTVTEAPMAIAMALAGGIGVAAGVGGTIGTMEIIKKRKNKTTTEAEETE